MPSTTVSVTVTTPAGLSIATLVDTLCVYWGYRATVNGSPNPQTKAEFVKAQLAAYLRASYISAKSAADTEAARLAAVTAANQVTAE